MLVLTGNPRGKRRRSRKGSGVLSRVHRIARKLRKRGIAAKRAFKLAWAKARHRRVARRRRKTLSAVSNSTRRHRAARRSLMARHKKRSHRRRRSVRRRAYSPNPPRRRRSTRRRRNPIRRRIIRRHRRARRSRGFLSNPIGGLKSFFVLPPLRTALEIGGGAVATWFVSNRFVTPFVARFVPGNFAPVVGNVLSTGLTAGVAGMVMGRSAAANVALGGIAYTALEFLVPMVSRFLAPPAAAPQATTTGYYLSGDDDGMGDEQAAGMDYYLSGGASEPAYA